MATRLLLVLALLVALGGCASIEESFYNNTPGKIPFAEGELQLLTSNPDYDLSDPLAREDRLQLSIFGRRNGSPMVTGGIGLMQVWSF